jgi:hypothetical protein
MRFNFPWLRRWRGRRPEPPHVCTAYCQDGLHATVVFVDRQYTDGAQWLPLFQQCQTPPYTVVAAREAPEADLQALITYEHTYRVPTLNITTDVLAPDPPAALPPWVWGKPWVIWWRLKRPAQDQSQPRRTPC